MSKSYIGKSLDGTVIEVTVKRNVIVSVKPAQAPDPPLIAPPLVDLQQNGALGKSFNHLHESPDNLRTIAAHVRRHGVGRMLATFTTYPYDKQIESLTEFNRQLESDKNLGSLYFGAFFEGIYMSREYGWRGAHNPEYMRDPNWNEWSKLQDASGGRIMIFNIDPELPHATETMRQAINNNLRITMGHCGPSAESISRAADMGVDMVTHFGNGAPPEVHRHRNPFWSWLADDRFYLGLIIDGHHLPGDLIRAAFVAKGKEKIYPVSDASGYSGMPPGDYEDFVIEDNGYCHLKGQELLSGAWHQADRCVERLCELGWSLEDAWHQQSVIPARIIGIPLPEIKAGEPAEFVLARGNENGLELEQVVSMGDELLDTTINPQMV